MKIQILSDLHLEFKGARRPGLHPDADVLVLAGDIHVGRTGALWADVSFEIPSVYVAGNHEFYRGDIKRTLDDLGKFPYFLENTHIEIDGVTFLGCTLWTDFELDGDPEPAMEIAGQFMNDFSVIAHGNEAFTPAMSRDLHQQSVQWLTDQLSAGPGPFVVVTHHAPSRRSISERLKVEPYRRLNPAFASSLEHLMDEKIPLWIHGHMHNSSRYRVGPTEVICNPQGYPHQLNPQFDPHLLVEVAS